MSTGTDFVLPAGVHYRRHLAGTDFALEANTERVPADGRFYLVQSDRVELVGAHFSEALVTYHGLCRAYWTACLESADPRERLTGAWGLVSVDPGNQDANHVIRDDGSIEDRKRLEQLQTRPRSRGRRRSSLDGMVTG